VPNAVTFPVTIRLPLPSIDILLTGDDPAVGLVCKNSSLVKKSPGPGGPIKLGSETEVTVSLTVHCPRSTVVTLTVVTVAVVTVAVGAVSVPVNVGDASGALVSICVWMLLVTPSVWFSMSVVAVMPSSTLRSSVELVRPTRAFRSVCDAVTAPVMFGKVFVRVLLIRRKWSSACARPSVDAGLVGTRELMNDPVSRAIAMDPYLSVFHGGLGLKETDNNNNNAGL
jgi:hypothetical protein